MNSRFTLARWLAFPLTAALFLLSDLCPGATFVSGNVSGVWASNQSPYILTSDCIVATNQTLSIQPGVSVILGPNQGLTVNGGIVAIGTPKDLIIFRGATSSNFWGGIVMNAADFTNVFRYCRFSEAPVALSLSAIGGDRVMMAEIGNCSISNCLYGGIDASAMGLGPDTGGGPPGSPTLKPVIHNCIFDSTGIGGSFRAKWFGAVGKITPTLVGNIFKNLTGSAILITNADSTPNVFGAMLLNNTIVDAQVGFSIAALDTDIAIENNIFVGTKVAIQRVGDGTPTPNVGYNCFYKNTVNFSGYPGIYGIVVTANHNNDPCDAFSNIFLDPKFQDPSRYVLAGGSPCIDAGDPAISDVCFPLSRGTTLSDIGCYGGANACNWPTQSFAPVIATQPRNETSCIGGSATFKVTVEGSEPLNYRWFFNDIVPLSSATNAELSLLDLQSNQEGRYSVTVSNSFGTVVSAPAQLLVFDACVGMNLYAGLSITGIVGRTYVVDASTSLAGPTWVPFATNTLTSPRWLFIDTNTPVNPGLYFRVRLKQ